MPPGIQLPSGFLIHNAALRAASTYPGRATLAVPESLLSRLRASIPALPGTVPGAGAAVPAGAAAPADLPGYAQTPLGYQPLATAFQTPGPAPIGPSPSAALAPTTATAEESAPPAGGVPLWVWFAIGGAVLAFVLSGKER